MSFRNVLLFIDANIYLDFYQMVAGQCLLAPLIDQGDDIFVTTRIVEEVQRNKLSVAATFFAQHFKDWKLPDNVPDHLFGTSQEQHKIIRDQILRLRKENQQAKDAVKALAVEILGQINTSEDEVSKALAPIFEKAKPHSDEELQRARLRKELGNPPGKPSDPLGDQLTWEQILHHLKIQNVYQGKKQVWIITKDHDYGTVHAGKGFLNSFLYEELRKTAPAGVEVFFFDSLSEGLDHFVKTTEGKADKLPTKETLEKIKKEEQTLPPVSAPTGILTNIGSIPIPSGSGPQQFLPVYGLPQQFLPVTRTTFYSAGYEANPLPSDYEPNPLPSTYEANPLPTDYKPNPITITFESDPPPEPPKDQGNQSD